MLLDYNNLIIRFQYTWVQSPFYRLLFGPDLIFANRNPYCLLQIRIQRKILCLWIIRNRSLHLKK